MGGRSRLFRDALRYGVLGSLPVTAFVLLYYNSPVRYERAPKFLKIKGLWGDRFDDDDDDDDGESTWFDRMQERKQQTNEYRKEQIKMVQRRGGEEQYRVPRPILETTAEDDARMRRILIHALEKYDNGSGIDTEQDIVMFPLQSAVGKLSPELRKALLDQLRKKVEATNNFTTNASSIQQQQLDDGGNTINEYGTSDSKKQNLASTGSTNTTTNSRWGWLRWIGLGRSPSKPSD
jgi:hypothetical protein